MLISLISVLPWCLTTTDWYVSLWPDDLAKGKSASTVVKLVMKAQMSRDLSTIVWNVRQSLWNSMSPTKHKPNILSFSLVFFLKKKISFEHCSLCALLTHSSTGRTGMLHKNCRKFRIDSKVDTSQTSFFSRCGRKSHGKAWEKSTKSWQNLCPVK